ncbi:hypothetical protein C8R44DRAFT_794933 [Mycena epipterygia]|nr:hypothetical protein C8R44DRAFT_794933 [Mycena epipterygia]
MADSQDWGTEFIPPPLSIETLAAWKNDPLPDHDALIARPRPHPRIFICAVQDSSPEPFLNGLTSRDLVSLEIRLIICQVCSHWRSVALDTHNLWSNVQVSSTSGTQCPLTLHVIGTVDDSRATELLLRHSQRLCFLSIHPKNPFVASPPGSLHTDDGPLPSMTAFARAPRLRSVTLHSVGNPINVEVCGIPWHQLTELYLDGMSPPPSHLWSILDGCNALGTAHLWMFQPDGQVPHVDRNIILPRLRTLTLSGDDPTTYATFLQYIDLPSLEDLALLTEDRPSDIYFSVTTLPSVQRLSIDASGDAHDAPMVVPWLRACPSAVAVCLRHYLMSDPTLDEIANGTLLPNVEMLTIYYADPGTVISALQARQKSLHSTITETGVHADFYTELSMHNIDSLTELMMSGVFLCDSDFSGDPEHGEVCYVSFRNRYMLTRYQIEQRARFEFETGSGVFERPSPPESDTPLP